MLRNAANAHIRRDHGMDDAPVPALDQMTGWSRAAAMR
jgi:hypothetical protein